MERHPIGSYVSAKAAKGVPSAIAGRGLVAVEAIGRGELVAIKGGHIVDSATLAALPERLQNSEIQIAEDFYLVALTEDEYESVMLFINHSCEPNVGFAGNVVLVAIRNVEAGEELTMDYAFCDVSDTPMVCQCGERSCRGVVTGGDWRRAELQRRFGPYFSAYVQARQIQSRLGILAQRPENVGRDCPDSAGSDDSREAPNRHRRQHDVSGT